MHRDDLTWVKSSSSYGNQACVELAKDGENVLVRHSAHPEVPPLWFTPVEFAAFLDGVSRGEFDFLSVEGPGDSQGPDLGTPAP